MYRRHNKTRPRAEFRREDYLKRSMRSVFLNSALLAVTVLTGCTSVSTTAQRDATISAYRDTKIDGVPLEKFLTNRTPQVVAGTALEFGSAVHSANSTTLNVHARGGISSGKAVAIDSRGYFLTAAHVVRNVSVTILFGEGSSFAPYTARIVWLGDNAPGQPDLALMHIDVSVCETFAWSQGAQVGDTVFAVGPNLRSAKLNWKGYTKNFSDGLLAGKLLAVPASATAPFQTVILDDDLPLHPGDSGGPLMDAQGRLLGINITVQNDYSRSKLGEPKKFTGHAIRPDPAWLQQLIEEDFIAHKSK